MADEEFALAARVIRAGLPCLRLAEIAPPLPLDRSRGGTVDLYDNFADVFTVLQVSGRVPASADMHRIVSSCCTLFGGVNVGV